MSAGAGPHIKLVDLLRIAVKNDVLSPLLSQVLVGASAQAGRVFGGQAQNGATIIKRAASSFEWVDLVDCDCPDMVGKFVAQYVSCARPKFAGAQRLPLQADA
eukprot:8973108-Pyramimonas_sp.AAC.1